MEHLREKQTQFNGDSTGSYVSCIVTKMHVSIAGASAIGTDVVFLSESCYRKGKVRRAHVDPVP